MDTIQEMQVEAKRVLKCVQNSLKEKKAEIEDMQGEAQALENLIELFEEISDETEPREIAQSVSLIKKTNRGVYQEQVDEFLTDAHEMVLQMTRKPAANQKQLEELK